MSGKREYRLTVCKVCGLEAPFECDHMRASKAGGENVYVSIRVVPESDAEQGRALVDRMFELPRGPEWEQALAELRAWSMSAWNATQHARPHDPVEPKA